MNRIMNCLKTEYKNTIKCDRFRLLMASLLLICHSLVAIHPIVITALMGAAGVVISEVLTDYVATERVFSKYDRLDRKMRKGLVTTITRTMSDAPNAQNDIKTFKFTYSSSYYQNTGAQILKSNSSHQFEPTYSGGSEEQLALGLSKQVPLEVRGSFCLLTAYDYDQLTTKFGYRVQWSYQNGAPVKFFWKDNRRFKVTLENWTPMSGASCGEQYNGTGAWYVSPLISRHRGHGEIICSPEKNLGGTINLTPNPSSQLLFQEHVGP